MLLDEENNGGELVQKTRKSTLKLALVFSLKTTEKYGNYRKLELCTCQYGKVAELSKSYPGSF